MPRKNLNRIFFSIVATVILLVVSASATTTTEKEELLSRQQRRLRQANDFRLKTFYGIDILDHTSSSNVVTTTPQEQLRYVTFGSSHVWGSGVKDEPGYSREDAFPYLLSPNVTNLAIRAHHLTYPTLCLETMLGEEVYDVAVILDNAFKPWNPKDTSRVLGRRLKERFPDIILIYIHHRFPKDIAWVQRRKEDNTILSIPLEEWANTHAPGISKSDSRFLMKMKDYQEQNVGGKWHHGQNDEERPNLNENMKAMQEELGENTFYIDFYITASGNALRFMELFANYACDSDYHHPCHVAHQNYAQAIQRIVQEAPATKKKKKTKKNLSTATAAPWKSHDTCETWWESPSSKNNEDHMLQGFEWDCFDPQQFKCALQLVAGTGSITLTNPTAFDQHVTLTFMATSPSHPHISYPEEVTVNLHGPDGRNEKITKVRTITDDYSFPVHVAKLVTIGKIPPGKSVLEFMATTTATKNPFALVSYAITDVQVDSSAFL